MSERNPISPVTARSADAFNPKIIENEVKDKLKRKVKNLSKNLLAWN